MERGTFTAEGKLEIGPQKDFFVFINGDFLGKELVEHFGLGKHEKGYEALHKVRITVEALRETPESGS